MTVVWPQPPAPAQSEGPALQPSSGLHRPRAWAGGGLRTPGHSGGGPAPPHPEEHLPAPRGGCDCENSFSQVPLTPHALMGPACADTGATSPRPAQHCLCPRPPPAARGRASFRRIDDFPLPSVLCGRTPFLWVLPLSIIPSGAARPVAAAAICPFFLLRAAGGARVAPRRDTGQFPGWAVPPKLLCPLQTGVCVATCLGFPGPMLPLERPATPGCIQPAVSGGLCHLPFFPAGGFHTFASTECLVWHLAVTLMCISLRTLVWSIFSWAHLPSMDLLW